MVNKSNVREDVRKMTARIHEMVKKKSNKESLGRLGRCCKGLSRSSAITIAV
jgi:hypothetical protein